MAAQEGSDARSNKRRRLDLHPEARSHREDEERQISRAQPPESHRTTTDQSDDNTESLESSGINGSISAPDYGDSISGIAAGDSIVTIGGPKRPRMHLRPDVLAESKDLKAKIAAFLPQMAEANARLANDESSRTIEDVEDGDEHIEMNLGLGVLEERTSASSSTSSSETSDEDSEGESHDEDTNGVADAHAEAQDSEHRGKSGVMDKLLGGRQSKSESVVIEELT